MTEVKKSLLAMCLVIFVPLITVYSPILYEYDYNFQAAITCKLIGFALSIGLIKAFGLSINAGIRPAHGALLGTIIGLGFIVPGGALALALRKLSGVPESYSPLQMLQAPLDTDPAYMGIVLDWILAPIFEESLLRIFLAQQLRRTMSTPMSVALSAVLFAVIHGFQFFSSGEIMNFMRIDFLPLMLGGIVLGTLYFKHGWISSMAAHSLLNIKPYKYVSEDGPEALIILSLLMITVGLVLTILLFIPKLRKGARFEH